MSQPPPGNPLWQLVLYRLRAIYREPATLFWAFIFPLLASLTLGVAFRSQNLKEVSVVVVGDTAGLTTRLDAAPGLSATDATLETAKEMLRKGRVALVVVAEASPRFIVDPTQPEGRTAQLLVEDALERANGRADTLSIAREEMTQPGARYIDFLIPGLLGMGLLSSGVWGVGYGLVQMRSNRLLKRLYATPMPRGYFLLSFIIARLSLGLVEVLFYVGFAHYLFGVQIFGSFVAFMALSLLAMVAFSGVGLMVASRVEKTEVANGLMNLVTMPMMVLSGVFFSSTYFPGWMQPFIKLLPLTALNDGLRAIQNEGAGLIQVASNFGIVGIWGAIAFAFALFTFRWQ